MKVTKELIEKYHKGLCTPEEQKRVEAWLLDDTPDTENNWPNELNQTSSGVQEEIWQQLSDDLFPTQKQPFLFILKKNWQIAATILVLFGLAFYFTPSFKPGITTAHNPSTLENKEIRQRQYSISLAPQSNISIDEKNGEIDFCGTIRINPKKDINFVIRDACAQSGKQARTIELKKGNNYFALNLGVDQENKKVVIIHEEALGGLPPLVQRQLARQFDI